jgi:pimeloyl-ACP methyl ester carboxylesterase
MLQTVGMSSSDRTVTESEELFAPISADLELCYQTFGDPADETVLLVMGLGGPMNWWDADFCRRLAGRGFHVVRYDNRDTGKSSRIPGRVTRSMLVRAFVGARVRAPYSISSLAGDAFALLDHLDVEAAHVVGISMGGMIAQTMAIEQPARVRSLTSIMSTTGRRTVGWQHPRLLPSLLADRGNGRDAYVKSSADFWDIIGSPSYPQDRDKVESRAGETFDRGVSRSGIMRHMMAVLTQPNRSTRLHSVKVPTLVVHGTSDLMVHVSGGRATAAAVPGSELLLVDGMGHDLPQELFDTVIDAIERTAHRS